jgi:hypothetical protein
MVDLLQHQHVAECVWSDENRMAGIGSLLAFGGQMKCTCPPKHLRAERKRVRDLRRQTAPTPDTRQAPAQEASDG